jgi:hypothetical protein
MAINYKAAEELQRGFYAENKFTLELRDLAEDVALIEGFKAKEARRHSSQEEDDLELSWFLDPFLNKVAKAVVRNKPDTLQRLGNVFGQYIDGFRDLSNEKGAALHVLVAGQILSLGNLAEALMARDGMARAMTEDESLKLVRAGAAFPVAELKALSRTLWARARCRAKGITADLSEDDERLHSELERLPEINWPRLWRKMGIKFAKRSKGKSSATS